MDIGTTLRHFKNRFLFGPRLRANGVRCRFAIAGQVAGIVLANGLAGPAFGQKKLNSVAVTVGDLGNPFFVQIAHGAQDQAKKINPAVKFTAQSSN